MRTKQETILAFEPEYVPENYFQVLDLKAIFPRCAPIEVDLGCGDGSFLVAMAKQHPQRNFLGLERLLGRVRSVCGKIAHENLNNARVLLIETSYAVAHLLPPNSVSAFYLLFPDPWPKRRHQRRRLVNAEFLASLDRALAPDGFLVVATDESNYFDEIRHLTDGVGKFEVHPADDFVFPITTFEKHFRKRGLTIHRLVLRKVSPVK